MVEERKLSEFSDDEFFARLKEKESTRSWTIGEILELERRGLELLDRDPGLKTEIEAIRNRHLDSVKKAAEQVRNQLLPFQNSLISTASLIERMNLSLGIPKKSLDWHSGPNPMSPQSLKGITGPVSSEVSNVEINQQGADHLLLEAALNKAMKPFLSETRLIRRLLSRDPVFWIIAASTFFSAIATIWMLVLTIQSH